MPPSNAASRFTASAPYRISNTGSPGLIFGYATLDERAITSGIETLGEVIEALREAVHRGASSARQESPVRVSPSQASLAPTASIARRSSCPS
jgi:hypothetical protein